MTEATLLFGVGATKAGTSWLHTYLDRHPQCHLRAIKEMHYFDMLDAGKLERSRAELQETRNSLAARPMPDDPAQVALRRRRLADMDDWIDALGRGNDAAYLAYLDAGRGAARLIADITPAYGLLSVGRLKQMAAMASDVRFVYLLRDPVERLWSHVRMIARRRAAPGEDIAPRAGRILNRVLRGEETHITERGDYRAVLGRLWAAVEPSRLLLVFHEELFSDAGVERLCRFLGLEPQPAPLGERIHAGVPVPMSAAQRAAAADFLAPQYDFVATRLGRIPPQWAAHRVGV
ncbi:sulfotransferase family protein [Rhodovulum bhavnagarense]|uniref:Sulfotransferase family protein n=1 Tax=Rhodovulum bhavnagarense TaxID=992286 RepID=A0A4V2SVJ1_9RHOB|nr:sulfotransferase [Rhodovulum bhavnagarense]TCP58646.1 sulfotransferase family protein [Rhodovulum bhavnagarense]